MDNFELGEHLMTCSICNRVDKSKYMRQDARHYWVCDRHSDIYIEEERIPFIRPDLTPYPTRPAPNRGIVCYTPAIAGLMVPGCTTAGVGSFTFG